MSITDVQIAKSEWLLSSWVAATQVSKIKEKLISRECIYTMTMQIPGKKKSHWVKNRDTLVLELTCQPGWVHKQWLKLIIVSEGLFHWDVTAWKHSLSVQTYWFFWILSYKFSISCMCCLCSVACCKVLLCSPAVQ